MSNYSEEIWILLTRVLSEEATREEKEKFRVWMISDPKNREFFQNLKTSWKKEPEELSEKFFFDYENSLGKLRGRLEQENAKMRPVNIARPGNRKTVHKSRAIAVVVVLAAFLSVFASLLIWDKPGNGAAGLATRYTTSEVEQRIITLVDGSVVRLNRNSSIEVNDKSDSVREVKLAGEAFFDVAKNPERPFIIHTSEAVVEVLGTSFSVKEGEQVMVAVQDGVVLLRNRENGEKSAAKLAGGQLGLLSATGQEVKIENVNIENYLSWMNGYMKFERMPFGQVILQLERIFGGRHIVEDSEIESITLTVYTEKIDKNEVLAAISTALDISYQEKDDAIYWQKKDRENHTK